MALTDPELDLLREVLEEEPGDDVYVEVARELLRRGQPGDALQVLERGLEVNRDVDGVLGVMAEAAMDLGRPRMAVAALEKLRPDPWLDAHLSRVHVRALDASGMADRALALAERFLEAQPGDEVVVEVHRRLSAPPPDARLAAPDPFVNVERAEEYVARGRVDRAVRAYRRILHHHPDDVPVEVRLRELTELDHLPIPDDLSEEITDPGQPPPDLTMPSPSLPVDEASVADAESTDVMSVRPAPSRSRTTLVEADDPTDVGAPERVVVPRKRGAPPAPE